MILVLALYIKVNFIFHKCKVHLHYYSCLSLFTIIFEPLSVIKLFSRVQANVVLFSSFSDWPLVILENKINLKGKIALKIITTV